MTLPLPWTFSREDTELDHNPAEFRARMQEVLDTVGNQFPVSNANLTTNPFRASGTQAFTWSASSASQSATVTHGLGTTPTQVIACNFLISGVRSFTVCVGNFTATTFDILATPDGAYTGTVNFPWAAIG